MGEAKRRKATDQNYGKIPKSTLTRGLVISPSIVVKGPELLVRRPNIDILELRFALLYWDKLVWPQSRVIHFASNDDEQFLEEVGILSRPEYTFNGSVSQSIASSQIAAFRDLDRVEPGVWALSQGENSLLLENNIFEQGTGAVVDLHRAIPIPSGAVPLNEILEFKERRRDELLALRHHMDKLLSEVQSANNSEVAMQQKIAEIDSACADLLKISREWQFPVQISDLKASFTISAPKVGAWAMGGWLLGHPFGLPAAAAAAAAGAACSALEIKGDFGLRSVRRPASPFRYACKAHDELR